MSIVDFSRYKKILDFRGIFAMFSILYKGNNNREINISNVGIAEMWILLMTCCTVT